MWSKRMTERGATAETILNLFEREGQAFSARNLATCVHRVGKFGGPRMRLDRRLPPLAERCRRRIDAFQPQEIANTAWGFAKTDFIERPLFLAIVAAALTRLGKFNPQELANTVWAFAMGGVAAETLFEAVAVEAVWQIRDFNVHDMAAAVWAFATMGVAAQTMFNTIALEAPRRIRDFKKQDMSQMVWAFATAGLAALTLFEAIAVEARSWIWKFDPPEIANTVWGFATAGVAPQTFFDAIAAQALRCIRGFTPQELTNTIWAFACVGWQQNEIFRELGSTLMRRFDDLNEAGKSQLYLVTLYVQMEWPDMEFPLSSELESLRSAYTADEPEPSQLQHDVSAMLTEMGWNHSFPHVTPEGISLDLADPEAKRAIQVDGPSHYLKKIPSTGDYVVSGATQFKARLLRALGWQITRVPFFDWEKKSVPERRELLTIHLAKIGVPHIGDGSPHPVEP